ncbi:type II secretion system secretin GspD [Telluria mixta]|uniref:Type II secretion system secretin GspD n=1 Tax=Telluria mixta TaxID=34071 RepID=A0ABT2BVM5_9BURK|nr:type II secretion system secretin GspD [Telluria mixta]MCS0629189.1 type II secretion system secretin GspD [Telluria mixta]WEM97630.1 type II secretion system secretin GspD [Telluria mixta]
MKKNPTRSIQQLPALRRIVAGAMLCCTVGTSVLPPFAYAQDGGGSGAALNFVNADMESVIKAVGHYTGTTFIIDPRVKGTLTLVSEKTLTRAQAFSLLTSALRLQGYAVVTGDGYAKVVPEAEAKLQSSPTQVGTGGSRVKGDQIATQVYRLQHESAANLTAVLRPLISPNNSIMADPGNNSLVITDYADNLRRLSKIIAALDSPATGDLDVVPIRNGIASDVATLVTRLMEPAAGGDAGRVTVLADPRTNAVIVRAPSPARASMAKNLIAKLDQPTTELGNIHVVYLKNADASKVAQTLRAVVSQDASAVPVQQQGTSGGSIQSTATGGTGTGAGSLGGQQGQSSVGAGGTGGSFSQQGQATSGGAGGGQGSGFIQADASTNSLIITAPDAVYRNLRSVIDQLDVRRAQVYIEALVVEVTSTDASEFGVQWVGLTGNNNSSYRVGGLQSFSLGGSNNNIVNLALAAATGISGASGTTTGSSIPTPTGLSIGLFKQVNGELGLGAIAHALESTGHANILSTPNMITLDNELATIKVGQNIPIITGSFTTGASGASNPFQTVDRKDVGLLLKVRPQISEGGTIKLAIYHENSGIDNSVSSASGIVTTVRAIESNVLADNGQIVVLGGLISDDESENNEKTRGLGDIPIIGNLFKYRTRTRAKRNLMVFLRPVVVRSKEQNDNLSMDRYEFMRAAGQTAQPVDDTVLLKNLGAPVLPSLVNGQPPVGSAMATMPPPAPATARPGAATGPVTTQPRAPAQPEFRPVQPAQPAQPAQPEYRPATPTQQN